MINKCDIEEILKDIPEAWRYALIDILIKIQEERESVDCEQVRDCETVTNLSEFTFNNTEICISYTNEEGITVERCFDIENIINETLADIDPLCITTPTVWNTMSYTEKIQALVDTVCSCCPETTTTTSTSTTTTTTV